MPMQRVAQRGEATTRRDPSPYHPLPLFPLAWGERGVGLDADSEALPFRCPGPIASDWCRVRAWQSLPRHRQVC